MNVTFGEIGSLRTPDEIMCMQSFTLPMNKTSPDTLPEVEDVSLHHQS